MNFADLVIVFLFFVIGMTSGVSLCRYHMLKGYRRAAGWDMLAFSLFFMPVLAWLYGFFGFYFKLSKAERVCLREHIKQREFSARLLVVSLFPLSVWLMATWLISLAFRGLLSVGEGQIVIPVALVFYMLITVSIYPILCAGLYRLLANCVIDKEISAKM